MCFINRHLESFSKGTLVIKSYGKCRTVYKAAFLKFPLLLVLQSIVGNDMEQLYGLNMLYFETPSSS